MNNWRRVSFLKNTTEYSNQFESSPFSHWLYYINLAGFLKVIAERARVSERSFK